MYNIHRVKQNHTHNGTNAMSKPMTFERKRDAQRVAGGLTGWSNVAIEECDIPMDEHDDPNGTSWIVTVETPGGCRGILRDTGIVN